MLSFVFSVCILDDSAGKILYNAEQWTELKFRYLNRLMFGGALFGFVHCCVYVFLTFSGLCQNRLLFCIQCEYNIAKAKRVKH